MNGIIEDIHSLKAHEEAVSHLVMVKEDSHLVLEILVKISIMQLKMCIMLRISNTTCLVFLIFVTREIK